MMFWVILFFCIQALNFRGNGPKLAARMKGIDWTGDYVYKMKFWTELEKLAREFPLDEKEFPFGVDDKPRLKTYLKSLAQTEGFKSLKVPLRITDFSFVDTSEVVDKDLQSAIPFLRKQLIPIISDFVSRNVSFVVKPSQGFRSHGVLVFKATGRSWVLYRLYEGEKRMTTIFPTNRVTLMVHLLINEMQRPLSYGDPGDAWKFAWGGTYYGYCKGFIFESYVAPIGNLVPELRFAFLYGQLYVASVYRSDDEMRMIYNRQTETYTSVYGISLETFEAVMETAKAVAAHFKFHWGRVDVFYDHIKEEFFVNEVQAKGTDDLFQCFTTPYHINFLEPCTPCMNRIMSHNHFWDFHTDYVEYSFKVFWGIAPYVNRVNSALWKNYTFQSYIERETRKDLITYCQWYDDNGYD